jgi:hypothetical protein
MANGLKLVSAMLGFLVLGLSPSFVDWKQSPELRNQMVWYYAVAMILIFLGIRR